MKQLLMEDVHEPIPYALRELYTHTMTRGAQVGTIISWLTITPLAYYKGLRGRPLLRVIGHGSLFGFIGGAAFLAMGTLRKLEAEIDPAWGAYDRAYRLRYNKGQVLWDKISMSTGSAGLVLGSVILNGGPWGAAVGLSNGLALGMLTTIAGRKAGILGSANDDDSNSASSSE